MEGSRRILAGLILIALVAGSIPGATFLFSDDQPEKSGEPETSEGSPAEASEIHRLSRSDRQVAAAVQLLSALTGTDASPREARAMVDALASPDRSALDRLDDPVHVLKAAEETLSDDRIHRQPTASGSLAEALENYANAKEVGPLSHDERQRIKAVPQRVADPLTLLLDALAFGERQRDEAFSGLTADEQAELLSLAARGTAGDDIDQEDVERFRSLSDEVEIGRLLHAARVLAERTLETREALSTVSEADIAERTRASEQDQTQAPQNASNGQPEAPDDNEQLLDLSARTLEARGGSQTGPSTVTSGSLASAVSRLAHERFPNAAVDLDRSSLNRFPPSLEASLTAVVDAHRAASAADGSRSGVAANVLRSLSEEVATLERWSLILSLTPPDTHFRSADELANRRAGLALASASQAHSLPDALRLAAYQSGLPGGQEVDPVKPLPLGEAFDAWEEAYGVERTPAEEGALAATAEALPDHVADALALMLTAQVEAAGALDGLALPAERRSDLLDAAQSVGRILVAGPTDADDLSNLERFHGFTTRQQQAGLRAALLLSMATAQAQEILDKAPEDEDEARDSGREAAPSEAPRRPGLGETSAPDASTGTEPRGPLADPGRDVWFEDPTGLILVTGEQESHYPDGFLSLSIDLGGDDIRPDNAGGVPQGAEQPIAVSLDAGGDDTYASETPIAQGAARGNGPGTMPVGILADFAGDDTYEARGLGQGASFRGGVGLLYDESGDDRYRVHGAIPRARPAFEIAGGQGYAYAGPGGDGEMSPPGLGALVDARGNDTYEASNGQGAGIGLVGDGDRISSARTASGVLLETHGTDTYRCEDTCLGWGRIGSLAGLECKNGGDHCWEGEATLANGRPGAAVATGTLVETDGQDDYRERGGPNNQIGPATAGAHPAGEPLPEPLNLIEPPNGFRVNQSTRIDVSLSDANNDFVPDLLAESLGYDPEASSEGPLAEPYEALDAGGLAFGEDRDRDGYSDELERRLGTDPGDRSSAPASPPTLAGNSNGDKLLDIRLDPTTGTVATQEGPIVEENPIGWIGFWPEGHLGRFGGETVRGPNGTGTDGRRVGLVGVGDAVATRWSQDYLVSVDLGGPDTYENNAGAAREPIEGDQLPESGVPLPGLAVDLGGSDVYRAEDSGPSQGTGGYGTFGILVDHLGDDTYTADRAAQGAAIGPNATGVLVDSEGSDVYSAREFAQGYAAPDCRDASAVIDDDCRSEEDCDRNNICRTEAAMTGTTALLVDRHGDDTYTSDGQGVLEPNVLTPAKRLCFACEPGSQNQVDIPPSPTPEPGPYTEPPSDSGFPAPADGGMDPTGDTATFLDLAGSDTYETFGRRDPVETQGYARGKGVPGQGSAVFVDFQFNDTYRQVPPPGEFGDPRLVDRNDEVHLQGAPGTEEGNRLVSLFLDVSYIYSDDDRDLFPDAAETWLGTGPGQEGEQGPVDPTRLVSPDTVLTIPRLGVHVSGFGDAVHNRSADLLVDLGGDDKYNGQVGGGVGEPYDRRGTAADVGVLLDVAGDDDYRARVEDPGTRVTKAHSVATYGAGVLGIGLHVDRQGADAYNATLRTKARSQAPGLGLAQGAAFQGVGVQIGSANATYNITVTTDGSTTDRPYLGLAQGAAWAGLGLQFVQPDTDGEGETRFDASRTPQAGVQGFAVEGAGLLVDPGASPTRFTAASGAQGAAIPNRLTEMSEAREEPNAASTSWTGALGLLATGPGEDEFHAPSLAQGTAVGVTPRAGLAAGMVGALVDAGGDDSYRLEPWNEGQDAGVGQGTGLLGGLGVLVDHAGDDDYRAAANPLNVSAAQGSVWTIENRILYFTFGSCVGQPAGETVGALADLDGRDRYTANGSLVHGSAESVYVPDTECGGDGPPTVAGSNALMYDAGGEDSYEAPHAPGTGKGPAPLRTIHDPGSPTGGETEEEEDGEENGYPEPPLLNTVCSLAWPVGMTPAECKEEIQGRLDELPPPPGGPGDIDPEVPSGVAFTLAPTPSGAGTFVDAGGADRYRPLPHPNATRMEPTAETLPQTIHDGRGNNEAWTVSVDDEAPGHRPAQRAGIGLDAPSLAQALARLSGEASALPTQGVASAAAVETSVRESREETCGPRIAEGAEANGTLCLQADVTVPQRTRLDEVRFYAVSEGQVSRPSLVDVVPGPRSENGTSEERDDTREVRLATLWDTRTSSFPDGNTTIQAQATLSPRGPGGYGSLGQTTARDAVAIDLDNPPWVTVDAPRWVNPDLHSRIDLGVRAASENGTANVTLSIGPCAGGNRTIELDENTTRPRRPATWTVKDVTLLGCPTKAAALAGRTGNVTISGTVEDGEGNVGTVEPTVVGIDRRRPRIDLDLPSVVNKTVGRSGAFPVGWNITETVQGQDFGRVQRVDVAVGVDGRQPEPWVRNAASEGRALWESFRHGGTVTVEVTAEDAAGNEVVVADRIDVDLEKPRLQDPGVSPRFVASGDIAVFAINATDDGGIRRPIVEVAGDRHSLQHQGGDKFVYDDFGEVTAELADETNGSLSQSFPFRFVVEDHAGNVAKTVEQQIFVDDVPPTVRDIEIRYPGGSAGALGDLLQLVVHAEDDIRMPETLTANVSAVSSSEAITLRRDPSTSNYTTAFGLDREPDPANASVTVDVRDRAGNAETVTAPVSIAEQAPSVSDLQVVNRSATSAEVAWSTDVPSTARLLLTDTGADEGRTVSVDGRGTDHAVTVDGLSPTTAYELRLVPLNLANKAGESRTLTFTTASAIDLQVSDPTENSVTAGGLPVVWNASDPTGEPMTFTFHLRNDRGELPIERELATIEATPGERHRTELDTTAVTDGRWELVVEAERGQDETTATVDRIVVDNTAPLVRVDEPRPGSRLASGTHELDLVAVDQLSGVREDSVAVIVDGERINASLEGEVFHARVPVEDGKTLVEILARDQAGNLARQTVPLFGSEELEDGGQLGLELPSNQTAAKPGDPVTVTYRSGQAGSLSGIRLLPSPITGGQPTPMEATASGASATVRVPEDVDEGRISLAVEGSSGADGEPPSVDLPVDATAPAIRTLEQVDATKTSARVRACANEPVRLYAHVGQPASSPGGATASTLQPCHALDLDGLTPGVDHDVTITVFDGAGNEDNRTMTVETEADEQAPSPPADISTRVPTDGVAILRWSEADDDTGVDAYEVRRASAVADDWRSIGTSEDTEFVDRSLEPGQAYRYAVTAIDVSGNASDRAAVAELTAHGSPSLEAGSVTPERGTEDQTYTFTVNYTGPLDGDASVEVVIDGSAHEMELSGDRDSCWTSCVFAYRASLPAERLGGEGHTFRFTAEANGFTAASPDRGRAEHGPVVTAGENDVTDVLSSVGGIAGIVSASTGVLAVMRWLEVGWP